ncbi:MAG: hypothetical protein SGJ18_14485 [Pseudomonadota bacterium]|nr:hypothetical protein [Pseudomonadota bacterium]
MSRVYLLLVILFCNYGRAQVDSPQTFIVPTGPSQSLEEESSTSRRYTVRPLQPKLKATKEKEPKTLDPISTQPATAKSNLEPKEEIISTEIKSDPLPFRRPSFIEIQIAPGLVYVDSKSNYWYRKYQSTSPGFNVNASLWIAPNFGFKCAFISSIGGDVSSGPADLSKTAVSQQWVNYGIQFRNWKSQSDSNSELDFGVKYSEFQFQPPLDSANRGRLKTTGASFFLQAKIPQSRNLKTFVEFEIMPKATHKEVSTTVQLRSGDKVDSSQVGIKIGNIHSLADGNSIFWSLNSSLEKNVFKGIASPIDPATNQLLNGVTVYNRTVMFFIGYQWGD